MATLHKIEGLIAWTRRDEWREAMASAFHHHVAGACEGAEVEPSALPKVIDDHAFSTVWGSAFEDLLAQDLAGARNIVDDYLKRRGWKESAPTREYMAGLRRSVLSLYEVSEVVAGESMVLRDLVRGGDPVRVTERSGSRNLYQWLTPDMRGAPEGGPSDAAYRSYASTNTAAIRQRASPPGIRCASRASQCQATENGECRVPQRAVRHSRPITM